VSPAKVSVHGQDTLIEQSGNIKVNAQKVSMQTNTHGAQKIYNL